MGDFSDEIHGENNKKRENRNTSVSTKKNGNGISGLEIGLRKNITEHVLKKAVVVYKDELESKTISSVR
ncbi:hypothetical protein C2G38_2173407 [Gigaspora rosea]|uniref:Uncharacterized protein n=1 Tax=Gigaspora rosea TaxID=44941 RepID=A0A397VNU4_9GLOM|nr:hypothetical protein C2G38_2173407 [Gigaspora rosea]